MTKTKREFEEAERKKREVREDLRELVQAQKRPLDSAEFGLDHWERVDK